MNYLTVPFTDILGGKDFHSFSNGKLCAVRLVSNLVGRILLWAHNIQWELARHLTASFHLQLFAVLILKKEIKKFTALT